MRLKGKGEPGPGGAGDALVTIAIEPHPFFRRDGDDVRLDLPITLDEAVARRQGQGADGRRPGDADGRAGHQSGKVLRLKGKGFSQEGRRARRPAGHARDRPARRRRASSPSGSKAGSDARNPRAQAWASEPIRPRAAAATGLTEEPHRWRPDSLTTTARDRRSTTCRPRRGARKRSRTAPGFRSRVAQRGRPGHAARSRSPSGCWSAPTTTASSTPATSPTWRCWRSSRSSSPARRSSRSSARRASAPPTINAILLALPPVVGDVIGPVARSVVEAAQRLAAVGRRAGRPVDRRQPDRDDPRHPAPRLRHPARRRRSGSTACCPTGIIVGAVVLLMLSA